MAKELLQLMKLSVLSLKTPRCFYVAEEKSLNLHTWGWMKNNNHWMDTSVKENEEVKEIFKTASEESVGILDINRKKVEHIPSGLFKFNFSCLQYLYLEGNVISS